MNQKPNTLLRAFFAALCAAVLCMPCAAEPGWTWDMPPDVIALDSNRRNNLFYEGDPIVFRMNRENVAVHFEVRDYWGNIVEQGPVGSGAFLPSAVRQPGWYKIYLHGTQSLPPWGDSVGATTFVILRNDPRFPSPPGKNVYGSTEGLSDEIMRGLLGIGPPRYRAINLADPDAEIARLRQDIARDKEYYLPFDPERQRALLVNFAWGTADLAAVRKIVEALKDDVKYWEPRNEPTFNSTAPDYLNNELKPFYELVKSIDPSLKVIGPAIVTIGPYGIGWIGDLLRAGGAAYLDGLSFHAYNNVNGDLWLTRHAIEELDAQLRLYGAEHLEKWQTEQGYMAALYGSYQPRLQARWTMLQMMVYEQHGIPKEHNHLWYDKSGGFWDVPTWWENEDWSLNPSAVLMRVYAEELYGKRFARAFDFGPLGNSLYVGNVFAGAAGKVAAFMTAGMTDGRITLRVTGDTVLRVVSPFGVARDVPVVGGVVTLPVAEIPTYVEFTGELAVDPIDWGENLARAPGVVATASGSGEHPAGSWVPNDIAKLNNGVLENWYWTQDWATQPWMDNTPQFPAWVELTFPQPQTIDRVVIYAGVPWQWNGSLLDYDLQVFVGSQWMTVDRVFEPHKTFRAFTPAIRCTVDGYYSERCIFTHQFEPVTTQKIRLFVRDTAWGGGVTRDVVDAGGQTGEHNINLREIEVFSTGQQRPAANQPAAASDDSAATDRDQQVEIDVLANDNDADNAPSPLRIESVGAAASGVVSVAGNRIRYTPRPGFVGSDSFTYTVSDGASAAQARVDVTVRDQAPEPVPAAGGWTELTAYYYDNMDFTALTTTRSENAIDHIWAYGSPPGVAEDTFSAVWVGKIKPAFTTTYLFHTLSDDGVRLWVDGRLIIDNWTEHGPTEDVWPVPLQAGAIYDVRMELFESLQGAAARLSWSWPGQAKALIASIQNMPPQALGDTAAGEEGGSLLIDVLANDSDPDAGPQPLALVSAGPAAHGSVSIESGRVRYTPAPGFSGMDGFDYSISDGAATASARASVTIRSSFVASDLTSAGLGGANIGAGTSGSGRILSDGAWMISGEGGAASAAADALHFEHQALSGDFQILVRLDNLEGTGAAGLMLRESTAADARFAALSISATGEGALGWRSAAGGSAAGLGAASFPERWLMLERTGDLVVASVSADGVAFREIGSVTLSGLRWTLRAGMFASGGTSALFHGYEVRQPAAHGLSAHYFDTTSLRAPKVSRIDHAIDFHWGSDSPDPSIRPDTFSARWEGWVETQFSETHTFHALADDGVRLWIDGVLILDGWRASPILERTASKALIAGQSYAIRIDYRELSGDAAMTLAWSSPSQPKQVIPVQRLRPALGGFAVGSSSRGVSRTLPTGDLEITGLGKGLPAKTDSFYFLGLTRVGDFRITTRVKSFAGAGAVPLAGLMVREDNGARARFASVAVTNNGLFRSSARTAVRASATERLSTESAIFPDAWLLLERRGDTVTLSVSDQNADYRQIDVVTLPALAGEVSAGFFLSTGSSRDSATALISDYTFTALPGSGWGLMGEYFNGMDFTDAKLRQLDGPLNFNWGAGSPDPVMNSDAFTVRWSGWVRPRFSQPFTFYTRSDEGVRLWVDDRLIIDHWDPHTETEDSARLTLTAGQRYRIRLEYFEAAGDAALKLFWSSRSQFKQIIPAGQLTPPE